MYRYILCRCLLTVVYCILQVLDEFSFELELLFWHYSRTSPKHLFSLKAVVFWTDTYYAPVCIKSKTHSTKWAGPASAVAWCVSRNTAHMLAINRGFSAFFTHVTITAWYLNLFCTLISTYFEFSIPRWLTIEWLNTVRTSKVTPFFHFRKAKLTPPPDGALRIVFKFTLSPLESCPFWRLTYVEA